VLKDNKYLLYGGYALAGVTVAAVIIPSESPFCLDTRVICAPLPMHMADLPSGEDGPQPLQTVSPPYATGTSISSVTGGVLPGSAWRLA
jgi:hypothetical protein